MKTDLGLVPVDDLINELRNRFQAMVICGVYEDEREGHIIYDWEGHYHTAIGLLTEMRHRLMNGELCES
jgi:hypothetical protein